MIKNIINIIKNKDITIPNLLFYNYKKLGLTECELIVIIYLINNNSEFDVKKIAESLNYKNHEVLEIIDSLSTKGIISIEIITEENIKKEILNLDSLYMKIGIMLTEQKKEEKKESNIFDVFEKEFARTLSPIEYQIITGWLDTDFTEEIILEALKEAVYNGVNSLRYIDKILFEWRKKGIKEKKDLINNNKPKKEVKVEEVFNYDWLNENE